MDHINQHQQQDQQQEGGHVVSRDTEGKYFQVEGVRGSRIKKRKAQYLLKWRGCEEATWEPTGNMCDSLFKECQIYDRGQEQLKAEQASPVVFTEEGNFDQGERGGQLMGATITRMMMGNNPACDSSFFNLWTRGRRILTLAYDVGAKGVPRPESSFRDNGIMYSLVVTKLQKDKGPKSGRFAWAKCNTIDLHYVATQGEGDMFSIQENITEIADFRSLSARKVCARMELFLTPASSQGIWDRLTSDNFEILPHEDSHQGCGFIPDSFFPILFPRVRNNDKIGSLQVRIFAPRIGVAKGMLFRKPGIVKIQLPPSMIKVGPSRINRNKWAVMIPKGTFPNVSNVTLGKYLDPDLKNPSSSALGSKPLSDMYQHILIGLGVQRYIVDAYVKRAIRLEGLKHAHVKGVRDPTRNLPEGSIFITGFSANRQGNRIHFSEGYKKIFITRSPCLEPSDAKFLPLVQRRPPTMPKNEWKWLRSLPFGHVLFSVPRNRLQAVPIPSIVGEGDLDGDDYFVCFDKKILEKLKPIFDQKRMQDDEKRQRKLVRDELPNMDTGPVVRSGSSKWFKEAQERMVDFESRSGVSRLIGKLYSSSVTKAQESQDSIFDKDARAYARAYKDSLDMMKHGSTVELPRRLKEELPESMQDYISWI